MPDENEPTSPIDPLTIGELLSISEAADMLGFTADFLRSIARSGRLRAKKSRNTWLTTIASIEEYKTSRSLKNIPKKYRDRSWQDTTKGNSWTYSNSVGNFLRAIAKYDLKEKQGNWLLCNRSSGFLVVSWQ